MGCILDKAYDEEDELLAAKRAELENKLLINKLKRVKSKKKHPKNKKQN